MAKKLFVYNPETCDYEPFNPRKRFIFLKLFLSLGLAFLFAYGMLYYLSSEYGTIKETKYKTEREKLILQIDLMGEQIKGFNKKLASIINKDDEIYRTILEGETIPSSIRKAGAGGADKYESISNSKLVHKNQILENYLNLDRVKRQMYIQTLSFDELKELALERNRMWASIPSIQPVYNKDLRRLSTIFGMRFHPILRKWRPHKGLDFMASKNTPVYATGNGIVKNARYSRTYGNVVDVDHGYGYITRYAHLNKFNIKEGDRVVRGQCIGFVGNTGLSVSDHLHYEVLKDNVQVNPIGYFQRELDDDDYEELLELAKRETVPLD